MHTIKVIGFDADDTLWVNEPYFQEVEKRFCALLTSKQYTEEHISAELFKTEMQNIALYGYGIKAFTLSMVETALRLNESCPPEIVATIVGWGKEMLNKPVELLAGVEETLQQLQANYKLVVATKGDLLDQQRKLEKSKFSSYFHHVEVMSNKTESDYSMLLNRLGVEPHEFMMVGNSLKSDVIPPAKLGSRAAYIPFHTTWQHETIDADSINQSYDTLHSICDVVHLLNHHL